MKKDILDLKKEVKRLAHEIKNNKGDDDSQLRNVTLKRNKASLKGEEDPEGNAQFSEDQKQTIIKLINERLGGLIQDE